MARRAATELHEHEAEDLPESPKNISINIVYVVIGLIDLPTSIARDFGLPASMIGLKIITLGISFPELLRLSSPPYIAVSNVLCINT